jgi:hypothetical protein
MRFYNENSNRGKSGICRMGSEPTGHSLRLVGEDAGLLTVYFD